MPGYTFVQLRDVNIWLFSRCLLSWKQEPTQSTATGHISTAYRCQGLCQFNLPSLEGHVST